MKAFIQNNRIVILCHILLAISVLPWIVMVNKNVSLIQINALNHPILDVIMYHLTRLPEIAIIIFVLILSFFHEKRMFLSAVIALAICGITIIVCKHFIFNDFKRPFFWISQQETVVIHYVKGIKLHSNGSFPSGHTVSAFCSLSLVAFMTHSRLFKIFLFILAVAMGYSRVYVLQHYLMDVYAGALIGFSIAFLTTLLIHKNLLTPNWQNSFSKSKK